MNRQELITKLKQPNAILLMVPLLLLSFMIAMIIYLTIASTPEPSSQKKKLTDTVEIKYTSPTDNEDGVRLNTSIAVTFVSAIAPNDKKNVHIELSPKIEGRTEWSSDNKTLTFIPSGLLRNSQEYQAIIAYETKKYVMHFRTIPIENVSQEDQAKLQEKADQNYRKWEEMVQTNYPWLDKLPLQTDTYFFYFDIDKKQFTGKLYPDPTSDIATDTQVATMKNEIYTQLANLNIPTDKFPIDWQITVEEPQSSHE